MLNSKVMGELDYQIIIGLEIHVQLRTKTKMFCGCAIDFGGEPNSRVCPVCLGLPGALPVMNRVAFEHAVLAAMALNCEIAEFTKWDRKSYYYPDLPKNYQISQYDLPLSRNGFIEIPLDDSRTKRIRITRVHLEEDAGKNLHTAGGFSRVDLNRAGTALLEIVTEPDMNNAAEVKTLAVQLQKIVRYLGVSEADMQKGHMRFEPNVNLLIKKDGSEYRTAITEIKNLNSFRALERSVDYEAHRQLEEFLDTGRTFQTANKSTRGWDDDNQRTFPQREKEEADDYRYFPDPDLLPVELTKQQINAIGRRLCELPLKKRSRFINEYKLSRYDAGVLTGERDVAEFFEAAVRAGGDAKKVCNWVSQEGLRLANEKGCSVAELKITPQQVAELTGMIIEGDITATAAAAISNIIIDSEWSEAAMSDMMVDFEGSEGLTVRQIAERNNLLQRSDAAELAAVVEEVIKANPAAVADAASGSRKSKKARGFLLGQVMQMTKGRANPRIVAELLAKKLD